MRAARRSSFVIAFFCAGSASLHAADGGVPSNEDLRHVRALAEPRVSPDGGRVLIRVTDATADGGRQHLWLVDVGANTARQITYSPAADKQGEREGRWLGNGSSVLFLAKRAEHAQLFRLPMSGGEAHAYDLKVAPIVDDSEEPDAIPPKKPGDAPVKKEPIPLDVASYAAAPDGRTIAIIAQDPQTPGEKKQKDEKADALWVDHDKHRKRLYLLDAESGKLTAVEIPSDLAKVAWAKKSDRLIALAEGPNHAGDLGPAMTAWLVDLANPSQASQLKELPATIRGGTWSDDGARFFFRAQAKADAPPGYDDLFELNLGDRSKRNVAIGLGLSLGNEDPVSVGSSVFQEVQRGFRTAYLNISGTKIEELHFDRPVARALHCAMNNAPCAWLEESGTQASALYFASRPGQGARLLNTPSLLPAKWDTPAVHAVRWKNEGLNIEGMLYLPAQSSGAKVPLVVEVHGGPTGAFIDSFSPMTAHMLAQGWAVLLTNPRGSTGYGAAFAAANKNDLGGRDLRDIMAGVDAVVRGYAIDPNKLALMGYSYGGEMAAFVEGKTDRFKAIVSAAPVTDQQSEYGTEDQSWYDRWFYGKPWEHREDAWRQSPLAYVAHAKTPFMLIQGEGDTVDPLGQSLEMYRALRQQGVTVQLLQYPRDNHGPLASNMYGFPSTEPWHGFDARHRLIEFIKAAFDKSG
ncbi:MAG TPA: prolyl oligopeptidase family serine peptidase [Steroidobacteraceae bacterium]|jgi:dipeptidyl aminopeptidase/acylaminoacyl peptidase